MASLQCRSGSWRVIFRHRGSQHFVALGAVDEVEADGIKARYEYLLRLLKQRLLHLPPGMDIVCFLRYDGKPSETSPALDQPELTLARIRDEYFETIGNGAVEKNTLYTARIHLAHIAETLGERFLISSLSHADLQRARELKPRIGCLSTFVQLFPRTPESEPIVGWRPALSHGLPFPSIPMLWLPDRRSEEASKLEHKRDWLGAREMPAEREA